MHPFKCTESKADHEGQKYAFNVRSQNDLTRQETSQQGKAETPGKRRCAQHRGSWFCQRLPGRPRDQGQRREREGDRPHRGDASPVQRTPFPPEDAASRVSATVLKGVALKKPSRLGEQCRLRASPGLAAARGRSAGTAGQRTALSWGKCVSQM